MNIEVYIHIGTEKTGTTSLQNFFQLNREKMWEEGICYPKSPGEEKHFSLTIFCRKASVKDDLNVRTGLVDEHAIRKFKSEFPGMLEKEVLGNAKPCEKLVLSSEHLSSRIFTKGELETLKELVRPYSARPKIIVYLRRQDEYLLSTYSTYVKSGGFDPFNVPGKDENLAQRYDYYHILEVWKEVFGRENIVVRIYGKNELIKGDIIDDFLHLAGIRDRGDFLLPEWRNESLDVVTLDYLRYFNKYVPHIKDDKLNPGRADILKVLSQLALKSVPYSFDHEKLAEFYARFGESNRKVASEYLGKDGELFGDSLIASEGESSDTKISKEELMEVSANIWLIKQQEIRALKNRVKNLEKRLQELNHPPEGIVKCIKRFLKRLIKA